MRAVYITGLVACLWLALPGARAISEENASVKREKSADSAASIARGERGVVGADRDLVDIHAEASEVKSNAVDARKGHGDVGVDRTAERSDLRAALREARRDRIELRIDDKDLRLDRHPVRSDRREEERERGRHAR